MVKKMTFVIGFLCLILVCAFYRQSAQGEEQTIYNLPISIQSALKNHPSLTQSHYNIKYYESGIDFAKSQFGPQITLHGSLVTFESEKDFSPLLTTAGSMLITRETSGTNYVAGLTLSQPIFTEGAFFGVRSQSVERERNNLEAQRFTDLKLQADVIYNVSDAYGKVLKTLNALQIEENSFKTSELLFNTALSKYKLDMINKVELLEAESILVNHKVKIETLKSDLEINLSMLANKIGKDDIRITQITTDMAQFRGVLCEAESIPPIEKLVEISYQRRNDLKTQEALVKSMTNNLNVIKNKRYPEFNLNASYFQVGNIDSDNSGKAWNVLARVDMPLFDFGKIRSEVSQEQNRVYAQQEALRALKNDIRSQIQENYQRVQSLKASLKGLDKGREEAREALVLAREKYSSELISELEVMKAQDKLSQVELSLYDTEVDLIISRAALKKSADLNILECQ